MVTCWGRWGRQCPSRGATHWQCIGHVSLIHVQQSVINVECTLRLTLFTFMSLMLRTTTQLFSLFFPTDLLLFWSHWVSSFLRWVQGGKVARWTWNYLFFIDLCNWYDLCSVVIWLWWLCCSGQWISPEVRWVRAAREVLEGCNIFGDWRRQNQWMYIVHLYIVCT